MNIEQANERRKIMAEQLGPLWNVRIEDTPPVLRVMAVKGSCGIVWNPNGAEYTAYVHLGPNFHAYDRCPVKALRKAIAAVRNWRDRMATEFRTLDLVESYLP